VSKRKKFNYINLSFGWIGCVTLDKNFYFLQKFIQAYLLSFSQTPPKSNDIASIPVGRVLAASLEPMGKT
jgi:hypothetical protein